MSKNVDGRARVPRGIFGAAWRAYLRNWGPLLGATLLLLLIAQMPITVLLLGPLYVGISAMYLAAARGRPVRFDQFFDHFGRIADSLIAGAIYAACATIPTLLLASASLLTAFLAAYDGQLLKAQLVLTLGMGLALVPLAATVLLLTPTFYFMADGETGWRAAMRESEQLVRAHWSAWTGLWVVLGLVHLSGSLLCCLPGIFITPWMGVAVGMLYDSLRAPTDAPGAAQDAPPAPPPIPGSH